MNKSRLRVLLVEDNPGDARLVRELVAEASGRPFDLEVADCLSGCLARVAQGDVDAVLLDLGLPDSQGLDTFLRVRAEAPEIPIVALTGLDDETVALQAVREGAQDYLVKGAVASALLVRSIRYAVERQRMNQAVQASEARLRRIIEVNADAVLVISRDGTVQFANPAAERLFDNKKQELVGRRLGFPLVPEGTSEIDVVQSPGRVVPAEARVAAMEWEGQNAYLVSLRDVTQRRRAEETLRQSETHYREVLELFPAVEYRCSIDRVSAVHHVSPHVETVLGFKSGELMADLDLWRR